MKPFRLLEEEVGTANLSSAVGQQYDMYDGEGNYLGFDYAALDALSTEEKEKIFKAAKS